MDIEKMKEAVGFDPDADAPTAFASKWAESLDPETIELVDLFVERLIEAGKSKKAAASYKSLVLRYLATGQISEGKSGNSMKSAVRSFIRFNETLAAGGAGDVEGAEELEEA